MTEPTLQEQSDAQDQQEEVGSDSTQIEIPKKFQNPDGTLNQNSLLKSYQEIESSKSTTDDSSTPTTDSDETPEETPDENITTEDLTVSTNKDAQFDPFFQEYERDGQLSDESFKALGELGVSRELAESYIGMNVLNAEHQTAALIDAVGGADQYSQMQAWATSNQTAEENQAFNAAVQGFNADARTDAVESLYKAWQSSNGIAPDSVQTSSDQTYSGPKAYSSEQEFYADMKTPQYKTDPAYRLAAHQRANRMYGLATSTKLT